MKKLQSEKKSKGEFQLKFKPPSRRITKRYDMAPTEEVVEEELDLQLADECRDILENCVDWFEDTGRPTPPPPPQEDAA